MGGGILGVDLMEDEKEGLVVHEINNTVEFRGAASVCKSDIPGSMADYLIQLVKKITAFEYINSILMLYCFSIFMMPDKKIHMILK